MPSRIPWRGAFAALVLSCGLACRGEGGVEAGGDARPPRAAADAAAMCPEHGVLEAVCTKCNPALVPVFQQKGDWCAEHGFPESFCPVCHPERGGRPSHAVAGDDAPADGTKVRLRDAATVARAGIETRPAVERTGATVLVAPARLVYDGTRLAHMNARSPGVVRAVRADVGSRVRKGDVLAILDSPDVGAERARLAGAVARVAGAREEVRREEQLLASGNASRKSLLAAEQELSIARAEEAALQAGLAVLDGPGARGGEYALLSPIEGVVTERNATQGSLARVDERLFEIVDTRTMWADLEVAEAELAQVAPGQRVVLRIAALGDEEPSGEVSYVAPAVDPRTRTALVRVPLANPAGTLRAHMYGEARIEAGAGRPVVLVPRAAVQRARGATLVFVRLAPAEFEARRVKLGPADGDLVVVSKGVRAGELVVTTGAFLLKTETLKDGIGAGCCEAD